MRLPRSLYDEIVAHATEARPHECCGLIATRDGEAVATHRITNIAPAPKTGFEMEPMEQYKRLQAIEDEGLEVGANYHSHPKTEPRPSLTDVNLAKWYPDTIFVIVGFPQDEPEVRAWRIQDRKVSEEPLEIV